MRTRSEELRARNRRVFAVSYLIAALILGAIFVWSPAYDVEPLPSKEIERVSAEEGEESTPPTSPIFVQVLFGPPVISARDGTLWEEPEGRTLEVGRIVDIPGECQEVFASEPLPIAGRVRLRVGGAGDADLVEVTESSGRPCFDQLIALVADALHYEWLPDDRFPPPVDLVQPVSILDLAEPL